MDYIHGYDSIEQRRLLDQARDLETYVYEGIDMSEVSELLEIGCGVGGQTEILLKRFPHLRITSVDISDGQLSLARTRLKSFVDEKRVEFIKANAMELGDLGGRKFDGGFVCWFLEHVPDPELALLNMKKVLKVGSPVWMTEINNSSFFMDPYSPNILKYWFEMNDYQWSINGHPFVGLQLGNYLLRNGYQSIETELRNFYFDSRDPENRKKFMVFFLRLLKSSSKSLIKNKKVSENLVEMMERDIDQILEKSDSIIQYGWVRGFARA